MGQPFEHNGSGARARCYVALLGGFGQESIPSGSKGVVMLAERGLAPNFGGSGSSAPAMSRATARHAMGHVQQGKGHKRAF
jgi:hypothetical protein